jgi:RND family efflux transporter MFP subunit
MTTRPEETRPLPPKGDEIGFALPEPAQLSPGKGAAIGTFAVVVLAGAFLAAYLPRHRERVALEAGAKSAENALPRVQVVTPKLLSNDGAVNLPGSIKPLQEAVLYSRANGYVRDWKADIGDKVKEDQLLAEIETPELDQELAQARAQLAQAEAGIAQATANHNFAKTSLDRYQKLVASGVATQQELDEKSSQAQVDAANLEVARAMVGTQKANLGRLQQLKSFARVTAPFAGIITSRTVDRGSLVAPGTTAPLFRLAATDPVRVFIEVPQDVAPSVRTETEARVTVREYPSRVFTGTVARAAGALNEATRTMTTEVRVPNADGALLSGMFAEVHLKLPLPHRVFELPATAINTDAKGVRVGVVGADGVLRWVPVVVERDLGSTVQVSTGVDATTKVVKLASPELTDGARVDATAAPAPAPKAL